MKAVELRNGFGLEALAVVDRPDPTPGPQEILVRMRAASLNYRDLQVVRGDYGELALPLIPVSDGAGDVVAVGSDVMRFRVGDSVSPIMVPDWLAGSPTSENARRRLGSTLDGVLAEYMCVPEWAAVKTPRHMTHAEAATLPVAGVTAWEALFVRGQLQPGEMIVVQGTGGVSTFALQLARVAGARVIITSSNDEKIARASALGASYGVNYRKRPEWHEEVLRLTDGRGADHVIEVVGGSNLSRSIAASKIGGAVSLIGYLDGFHADLDLPLALRRIVTLHGISVGSRASYEALVAGCEASGLRPIVDRVFAFSELPAALEYLALGRHFGKVVISFD